ncbi:MAG: hypothetical protein LBH87_03670 [Coriobacteriales bacterium]|jgi:hypothetical protein|nr:hypothetical protein [Coriobacteriales bacterium]
MPSDRIEVKVARLIDARSLVFNRGSIDGIEVGMRFAVLSKEGLSIRDPDTETLLGSIEIPKAFVKITDVQERLSIARTFREYTIPAVKPTGFYAMDSIRQLGTVLGTPGRKEKVEIETLRSTERFAKEEMSEEESLVKIGDIAVQVIGDEFPVLSADDNISSDL